MTYHQQILEEIRAEQALGIQKYIEERPNIGKSKEGLF
jgi:hypothetical protein